MDTKQMLGKGVELAEAVGASWEAGNLAEAVRNLTTWASQARDVQTEPTTECFQVLYLEANGDLRIDSTSFTSHAAATAKADQEATADPAWSLRAWILCTKDGLVTFDDAGTES